MTDPHILRARFTEILATYDLSDEVIEEIVEELVGIDTKLEMETAFDDVEEPDELE